MGEVHEPASAVGAAALAHPRELRRPQELDRVPGHGLRASSIPPVRVSRAASSIRTLGIGSRAMSFTSASRRLIARLSGG